MSVECLKWLLSKSPFKVQRHDRYEWYLLDTDGNIVGTE